MSRKSKSSFLDDGVGLLVQYFGVKRVWAALAKVSNGAIEESESEPRRRSAEHVAKPSIKNALEKLHETDEEKSRLLSDFYMQLKNKRVLPESQDIRHFAQLIGLKEITGKSRKDMIPRLMQFLLEQPIDRLRVNIETAASVSEQQRQKGFSLLTDKLLGDKKENNLSPQ
jgi:hypothetical protein